MISKPIQEFESVFETELSSELGSFAAWESPRLTTMYPVEDAPKGAGRAVCHTVNGILRIRFLSNVDFGNVTYDAGLWGDIAGIPGAIQTNKEQPAEIKPFGSQYFEFDLFSNRANLLQNIYIRFTLTRTSVDVIPVQPRIYIKAVMSGVLLGGDIRV
jgi:hypothetical protein